VTYHIFLKWRTCNKLISSLQPKYEEFWLYVKTKAVTALFFPPSFDFYDKYELRTAF